MKAVLYIISVHAIFFRICCTEKCHMKSNLYLPDGCCLKFFLMVYLTRYVEEPCSLSISKISAHPDCITLSTCETDSNAPLQTSFFETTVYIYFIQFGNIFMFFVGVCMFPWPNVSWLIKSRRMKRACM